MSSEIVLERAEEGLCKPSSKNTRAPGEELTEMIEEKALEEEGHRAPT